MKKFLVLLVFFLSLGLVLWGCDKVKSSTSSKKPIGDCLVNAIEFYSNGGNIFEDKGCNITTSKESSTHDSYNQSLQEEHSVAVDYVRINSQDTYNGLDRTLSARFRADWLSQKDKTAVIKEELSTMLNYLSTVGSQQDAARNPLNKQTAAESSCYSYALTVNNVPGAGYVCKTAPHIKFEVLEKRGQ